MFNTLWICFVFITYFATNTYGACPNIISRSEWGSMAGLSSTPQVYPPSHVIVHHSSSPTCTSPANCAALVRSIQKHHIERKHYQDIGYNFLVGEDGNVYEGVGWNNEGTHADNLNSRSIGICILGDYTSWLPNEKAQSAIKRLIECGVDEGYISRNYKLLGHRQLQNTECPGMKLSHHLRRWRHWANSP